MLDEYRSTYRIVEKLKSSNWMLAALQHVRLDNYIANENVPGVAKKGQATQEIEAQRKWSERDAEDSPESI